MKSYKNVQIFAMNEFLFLKNQTLSSYKVLLYGLKINIHSSEIGKLWVFSIEELLDFRILGFSVSWDFVHFWQHCMCVCHILEFLIRMYASEHELPYN